MADRTRETEKANKKVNPEQRARQQESGQLANKSLEKDQGSLPLTGTSFYPRMDDHATTLSSISTPVQRHQFVMQLQQTYGNRYIQRLVNGTIATPGQRQAEEEEEEPAQTITEPETTWQNKTMTSPIEEPFEEEEPALTIAEPETTWHKLYGQSPVQPALTPPTLDGYPEPTRAAGMVVVENNAFAVWISSLVSDCIRGGVVLHEQKHINDFVADAEYSIFPTTGGAQNGQTFYYGSRDDQIRFETAAVAVESAWIRNELARTDLSESDRKRLQKRVDITLPNYLAGM